MYCFYFHLNKVSFVFLRCCTILNKLFMNRQDACSTKSEFFCGTGILPVLENRARCEVFSKAQHAIDNYI
ncbi:hypothetical protein D0A34_13895 [Microcoleus vaginatus PCC 9802]|nr:hypothetical protein D0A34_13895 [Microcoleus vaginatus PCC 9802]